MFIEPRTVAGIKLRRSEMYLGIKRSHFAPSELSFISLPGSKNISSLRDDLTESRPVGIHTSGGTVVIIEARSMARP